MIYLDNNTFQQEIFIPRSSVKNDASPEYATKNELENAIENEVIRADEKYAAKTDLLPYATTGWVESQDFATKEWTDGQIQSAIASETERTEETYQKKSEMVIYSTTNEVENMINNAVSGKMDTSAMSAYTKTENFATINGSAITEGGNIVIEGGGSDYSAGSNINIDENNVISVTGITVPTSNTAFTNDAGYVTSGEVETQITDKNYATENWVQDNVNLAIESETARTESTYAKIGDIPSLDGYATTGWVESQGYLTEHQDISGKLDSNVFTAYTANTKTEIDSKQDASAMTAYYTSAQTDTAISNATNGLASEEWVEAQGYLTGYTETDPVFMASPASGITSQDITNWNSKLDASSLDQYYTSAETDIAIDNAVSGKADLSAVTAQISEVKQEIEAEIPTKVSSLQNDLNFVNSGDVKTQVEGYNYINSGQAQTQIDNSISGKLDSNVFTTYTASTQTELNGKQDISGMTEYATTAFTESTYLKEHQSLSAYSTTEQMNQAIGSATAATTGWVESQGFLTEHQSLSAYTPTSGFSTINGSAITEGGNIVVEETPYSGGTNIDITDHIISVTGITVPTKLSELTNDEGFINSGQAQTQIDNAVSGKQDTLVSGENIKTINNQSLLGSGNIEIQGGGEAYSAGEGIGIDTNNIISVTGNYETIVELTQAEYDALTSYDKNTTYVITDAPAVNLSAYTPTSGFSTINGNVITDGGNIVIQGGGGSGGGETVIELTQAQYDALTGYAQDTTYIITDAPSVDLDNYYTSAQTESAITAQTSLKQDTLVSGTNIKTINGQSILGNGDIYISQGIYYNAGAGLNLINGNTFEVKDYNNLKQGARLGEIEKVISIALNDLNNRLKNLE